MGRNIRGRRGVVDQDPDRLVAGKIDHVRCLGKAEIALVRHREHRVVVVHAVGNVVKLPQVHIRPIGINIDIHDLGSVGCGDRNCIERDRSAQIVIRASTRVGHIPRLARRCAVRVGLVVVHGSDGVWLVRERTRRDVGAHPKGRFRAARVGGHEHVGALPNAQGHNRCVVRLDGHEIVGNHRHDVVVDGETLDTLGSRIDQAQSMRLVGLELELGDAGVADARRRVTGLDGRAVEIHLAVDQVVDGVDQWTGTGREHLVENFPVLSMVPICAGRQLLDHTAKGNIVSTNRLT